MLSAFAATILSCVPQQAPADNKVDFLALGKAFLAAHCDPKASSPCKVDDVLERGYVKFSLGPYDLEIPHSLLADKPGLEFMREIASSLALHVKQWMDWQGAGSLFSAEMANAVPTWMATWKPVSDAAIKNAKSRDLLDVMSAADSDRALLTAIETACHKSDKLALVVPEGKQLTIILAPTRLDFMQWDGYSGLVDESLKAMNWFDDAAQWTQFWLGWKFVLALEYASWNGFDPSFKASQPMKKVGKGILGQHVVQQATHALLRACRPSVEESRYEGALAMVMTIDSVGEINTIDGAGGVGTSGSKTRPYSKFVPGGNPKGGTLPGRSSAGLSVITESRWRKGHGADGFALPLKNGQLDGVKAAKAADKVDPLATFVLHQEDNSGKHIVHAPFFGPHADDQEYPPLEYLVDYAEFYRAYKTGFLYWMEHSGVDPKNPPAKWAEFMSGVATVKNDSEFEALAAKVYGLPLSAKDGSTDSLEWRFLKSIAGLKAK